MRTGQLVLVKCKFRRGAFSGERVFRLPMAEAPNEYVGIAPVGHCLDQNQVRLGRDQPSVDVEIDGFIEAYLIANGGAQARIELPDGEAIRVPIGQVAYQREQDQGSKYVPVRS